MIKKVYTQTRYIEFKSGDNKAIIPEDYFFTLENTKSNYWTLKYYTPSTKLDAILKNKVKGTRATISKEDANRLLTMYDYIIWKNIPLKGGTDILKNVNVPMSKNDILKMIPIELKTMNNKDELYIYKHYAKSQGKMGVKRLIKQDDKFIEGDLLIFDE